MPNDDGVSTNALARRRSRNDRTSGQAPFVRTVLGDRPASEIGVTNSHDHLFFSTPRMRGGELDSPVAALAEAVQFVAAGGRTIAQWTPRGLGRRRQDLAHISMQAGVTIVSATGRHRAEHYANSATAESIEELTEAFVSDIENSEQPSGFIKVGTGFHHLDAFERNTLAAAAYAHRITGAAVAVHLELGTGGDLVLDSLFGFGVAPPSVILGHVGRNPDHSYLADLAGSGVFLCFDGPSRANHYTDLQTQDCLERLSGEYLDQLLIGADTTTAAARSVAAGPGMPALLTRFGRKLTRRLGDDGYRKVVVDNPGRAFAIQRSHS